LPELGGTRQGYPVGYSASISSRLLRRFRAEGYTTLGQRAVTRIIPIVEILMYKV
jgi:hypothetical protein